MQELRKIYLIYFLAGLTTSASVTFTIYFLSLGLNQFQIGQLFAVFMLVMAIFNIPTGVIADIFGHKLSVFIGLILQALGYLFFIINPNYFGILLGFISNGLGLAFQSGAISSLIYEILKKENLHQDFQKVFGKAGGVSLIAGILAGPIGSFTFTLTPIIPYFFSFLTMILAAIVLITVKWEFKKQDASIKKYFSILMVGTKLTLMNKTLLGLIIIGTILTFNRMVFNQNIIQPYQVKIGIDVAFLGITAAVLSAIAAFISFNSHKIYAFLGKQLSLLFIISISSFIAIILSFINSLIALPFLFIFVTGHALRDPVFSHITQQEIESDKRSTMSSAMGFLTAIIAGVMIPFGGKSIDIFGMSTSMFLIGIITFIFGTLGLFIISLKPKLMRKPT